MTGPELQATLTKRLVSLEERIYAACQRAHRTRDEITLVAVTKSLSPSVAALLPEIGLVHLGESRPQELWRKAAVLPRGVHWHLIGHLQRNKVESTLPLVHLIHSVDSLRLLASLQHEASKRQQPVSVLLEVNASSEPQKHGFAVEEIVGFIPQIVAAPLVQVRGLMTMAVLEENPEACRSTFAALRELRDSLSAELGSRYRLEHLSMGMTNDFEVAIEEGATLVRIGTALFEGLAEGPA